MLASPLPHRIERTKLRSSRAMLRDGIIVIRLAHGLTATEEQEHIDNLLRRMAKMVARDQTRTLLDPFRSLLEGGNRLTLHFGDGRSRTIALIPGHRTIGRLRNGEWHVSVGPETNRRSLHRFLWKLLARSEHRAMETMVDDINDKTLRANIRGVKLRRMSSQWGSCSPQGMISLNTALLFAPQPITEYVIIHELAHRVHANHSTRFWQTVESVLPAYQHQRKMLRTFRVPQC